MNHLLTYLKMSMNYGRLTTCWLICASISASITLQLTTVGFAQEIRPRVVDNFLQNGFRATIQIDSTLVCAMKGGLGVLTFSPDSIAESDPGDFKIHYFFELDATPVSLRYDDFTLVVRMADGDFRFYTLESSLRLRELGSVTYSNEIHDFLYKSGNLYFAEEFRGVTMHHVSNFNSLTFVDSSMLGVRVIQLEIARDTLYVLDDYNGILRYPNPESGLQAITGYLRLPFQIQSFTNHTNRLNLAVGLDGIKTASFDTLGFIDSLFTRETVSFASKVIETDSNYIIISAPNVIEVQDKQDPGALSLIPIRGNTLGASLMNFGDKQVFVTPSDKFGLLGLWMNVNGYPRDFATFDHPGQIRALHIVDGFLYTAGNGNPFEKYDLSSIGAPELVGARDFPEGTSASAAIDDQIYLIDNVSVIPQAWVASVSPDALPLPLDAFGIPFEVNGVSIHRGVNATRIILLRSGNKYFINQASPGALFGRKTELLNLGVGVTAATVQLNRVYHYSSKSENLVLSELDGLLGTTKLFSRPLAGPINCMLAVNGGRFLLMFSPNRARLFLLRQEFEIASDSLVVLRDYNLEGNYTAAVERDGLIFAVGPNSTGIIELKGENLTELYHEPTGAKLVTAGFGVFATSDGSSIKIYEYLQTDVDDEPIVLRPADFRLLDNYPNPFNGETLLRFSGSPRKNSLAQIVVYNVLGQKVRELSLDREAGGVVRWDGRDEHGAGVASGMYFARLLYDGVGNSRAVKMIYLK